MRRIVFSFGLLGGTAAACALGLGIGACSGDDTASPVPVADAGSDGSVARDGASEGAVSGDTGATPDAADATSTDGGDASDAATPVDASDASDQAVDGAPAAASYLQYTHVYDGYAKAEVSTFDLLHGSRVQGPDLALGGIAVNVTSARGPWVLDQGNDVAYQMDPNAPAQVRASWSVKTPALSDAGQAYSDPCAVAETATKAYLPLLTRNTVAVLDTTQTADGGAPVKVIDLSAFVNPNDSDGLVDVNAAFYDAARNRVWIVLANYDTTKYSYAVGGIECTPGAKAVVKAIDVVTDTLVAGVSFTLQGRDPSAVVYDSKNDRLLVSGGGCFVSGDAGTGDAGAVTYEGRVIEQVKLSDGTSTILLDGNTKGFPNTFVYGDEHHAFLQYGIDPLASWDPTTNGLGAPVTTAPDIFVWEPQGTLVGPRRTAPVTDGGTATFDVVRVSPGDGGLTVVGSNAVVHTDFEFWGSAARWP